MDLAVGASAVQAFKAIQSMLSILVLLGAGGHFVMCIHLVSLISRVGPDGIGGIEVVPLFGIGNPGRFNGIGMLGHGKA